MKSTKEMWNNLPQIAKIVLVIVMVIIAIYILNYLRGYIKAQSDKASTKGEESSYKQEGMQPSFNDSWYKSQADELVVAMKGAGTDETLIKQIFGKLNNNLDALKLNQAFGQRTYTCYGFTTCSDGLKVWLEGEGMLDEVKQVMSGKGITYVIK